VSAGMRPMQSPAEADFADRRLGLPAGTIPFASRILAVGGARLHHVDEGDGPLLLMLHGNPSGSYLYRHLIGALRDEFRCLAIDLPGFGLSDAPPGFGYTPAEHAVVIAGALEVLDVRGACLVAYDWGGPIGRWANHRHCLFVNGCCRRPCAADAPRPR